MRPVHHVFMLFLLGAALIFGARMQPAAPQELPVTMMRTMNYAVYGGGIRILTGGMTVAEKGPEAYRLTVTGKTEGILRFLTPWRGGLSTEGIVRQGELIPRLHDSMSVWPDRAREKKITYDAKGRVKELAVTDDGRDVTAPEARALGDGAHDLLTAALGIMRAGAEGSCGGSAKVFDGTRRFVLTMESEGTEILPASRRNAYAGPALRCRVGLVPDGGDWSSEKFRGWGLIAAHGAKPGDAPVLWLAPPETPGGPAIPVKMQARSRYGVFIIHLTDYRKGATS